MTVVFDGWRGGWVTEKGERKRGIDLIFSKLGETADEVIKRLVKERGSGAVVVTSDRDISKYAQRMSAAVIPSEQFRERIEYSSLQGEAPRPQGGASGTCRCDHTVGFPPRLQGGASSRLAREGREAFEEEETGSSKKGPSRRLSKKEKRLRAALKKL